MNLLYNYLQALFLCIAGVVAIKGAYYGEGSGSIYFTKLECDGTEEKLVDCTSSSDTRKCSHGNDSGVICGK